MPLSRHLALAYPGDPVALASEEELMFGPDLLIAPVIEPGARSRQLYLPRGRWVDFWRAVRYRPASGEFALAARARPLSGARRRTLPAPLEELPMLARAGALIPLLPPDVDTLAETGRERAGIVSLRERAGSRRLLAFPRGRSAARLDRGRLVSTERIHGPPGWRLEIRSRLDREWSLEVSLATLRRPFVPCEVTQDGRSLPASAWDYEPRDRVLSIRARARTAVIAASGASQCPA
jgi:hypothetical protein